MGDISFEQPLDSEVVMTLGTFDGVHIGHQRVIETAVKEAERLNCASVLFTFADHPRQVVEEAYPNLLTSWNQKQQLIKQLGIDYIVKQQFNPEFARLTYQEFVNKLLDYFPLRRIVVGEDFSCGYQGEGTPDKLNSFGQSHGFAVDTVQPVKVEGEEVSSTLIRHLIKSGKVDKINNRLGRNFTIEAEVVSGAKRGRKLGFPTANLAPKVDYVFPPAGVYACLVRRQGKTYQGVVNLGISPTFINDQFTIEVYIFDFDGDLYGEQLELEFVEWIRAEKEFTNKANLIEKIKEDVEQARSILKKN